MKLDAGFGLTPEAIVAFFRSKGLRVTWSWRDMWREEHQAAFTIAKMMDMELLATVQEALAEAIEEGWTLRQFQDELIPILQNAGWWGREVVTDPTTGVPVEVDLGSPHRLETIFRTNLQTSYATGNWDAIEEEKDIAPWLMYDAVNDSRTRDEHAALDGFVRPVDDPIWDTISPPNGFRCRCAVLQLDDEQLAELGYQPATSTAGITVDEGWDYNPGKHRERGLREAYNDKRADHPEAPTFRELQAQAVEARPES